MDIGELMAILPHRYPFLMVDRLLELEPGVRGKGVKNVTVNEPQFLGHYPGRPLMPGVLILEAMAQVAGAVYLSLAGLEGRIPVLAGIDRARFRRPAVPGDQLIIEVELGRAKAGVAKASGRATVDGAMVAEAELIFASMAGEARKAEK
ncbi:MAG: 3-hydroxyacyl-ACP dehydratase FabZ [Bacillota bacterium]|nr:3-hydroxyacyl-ACP dehydratase FabZ [Bacillota bacterium]